MIFFFTILSFVLKVIYIHSPDEVVFDEVHFGKFASYYLRNEYYFDVHPPLGKVLEFNAASTCWSWISGGI